jgi:hypothetical protein
MTNDLISRQAAIDALYKMLHDCFWADDEELDAVITTLNELPSAQPRKKGKWKRITDDVFADRFECSECGKLPPIENFEWWL